MRRETGGRRLARSRARRVRRGSVTSRSLNAIFHSALHYFEKEIHNLLKPQNNTY